MGKFALSFLLYFTLASAQALQPALTDFLVYTSDGIRAHNSDYQGRTGSAGPIELLNFNINMSLPAQASHFEKFPWALLAKNNLDFYRGSVTADQSQLGDAKNHTNILAKNPRLRQVGYYKVDQRNSFENISVERDIDKYANHIENELPKMVQPQTVTTPQFVGKGGLVVNYFNIEAKNLNQTKLISFTGDSYELFVVHVSGSDNVELYNTHFDLNGVKPNQILFYFADTPVLVIRQSGTDVSTGYGIPANFFAPRTKLIFNQALITGSVWVREIDSEGYADALRYPTTVSALPSGQINYGCFPWTRLGLQCECQ